MNYKFNIGDVIKKRKVISDGYYINGKMVYDVVCECGKIEGKSLKSLRRKHKLSDNCNICNKLYIENNNKSFNVGDVISNITIISYLGGDSEEYFVECKCGHKYKIMLRQILEKLIANRRTEPYCYKCRYLRVKPMVDKIIETKNISNKLFKHYQNSARLRNLDFNLTIEYMQEIFDLQNGECYYCGKKLNLGDKSCDGSLDRIDSNLGYVIGNVQWVGKDINYMKSKHSHSRFIEICKLINNKYNI